MRLIDANKLKDDITNTINEWIEDMPDGEYLKGNVNFSVMARELVESQPTAYDVDKVIKQFKKESFYVELTDGYSWDGVCVELKKAIEIVKVGGIDD